VRPVIILFAKAPVPGCVKTRLAQTIGPEAAATLHERFVTATLERICMLSSIAGVELHTDIETGAWRQFAIPRKLQCAGDLGTRMLSALQSHPHAMILGSDSPNLPVDHLTDLLAREEDVVLGPAEDGGYYAISCRRTHPDMFHGVRWSTGEALADTVHAARACGLTVSLGQMWFDVDTPGDLERLSRME
jgi:hypothetical protein